ncbi:hypothetical protein HZB02_04370 [Candidatus Woesearchaeota archaeon]|nr:hypothetical protein [Candidatus Woesearchaeota archaeon]
MKNKLREWLHRYGPAEVVGIVLGMVCATLLQSWVGNIILSAVAGTWVENLGFYGTIIVCDVLKTQKGKQHEFWKMFWILFRNTFVEFGPSEALDSFLIRPFLLMIFPLVIVPYALAFFLGAMVANISYYLFTVLGYEFRKKKWGV